MFVLCLAFDSLASGTSWWHGQIELSADGASQGFSPGPIAEFYAAYGAASAVLKNFGEKASRRILRVTFRRLCVKLTVEALPGTC